MSLQTPADAAFHKANALAALVAAVRRYPKEPICNILWRVFDATGLRRAAFTDKILAEQLWKVKF